MASGPARALNATATPTPTMVPEETSNDNHSLAPVISASVVAVCLLLVVWCIFRCTRRRPPAASWRVDGPKPPPSDPSPEVKSQRSVSAAASDHPLEVQTPHGEVTSARVRSRMQSYIPETESANSSSDHGGNNENKPLIHRSMSSALHRICQSPVSNQDRNIELPNSIPSPSSSFRSPSHDGGQLHSREKSAELKNASSGIFSDTLETYHLPIAQTGSKCSHSLVIPDGPTAGLVWTGPALTPQSGTWSVITPPEAQSESRAGGLKDATASGIFSDTLEGYHMPLAQTDGAPAGLVWTGPTLTPQSGTWSVISPAEEAVDRHIDNIVTAEVAHLNAVYAMQVGSPGKHYEEAEVVHRQRRRRASSVDSSTFGPALRRSRYLSTHHRDQRSQSPTSVPDLEDPDLQSVSGPVDDLSASLRSTEV
eukprot:GGOE01063455.1.p1 GENE.GGOE01063455.1~~GGOE01063455.1.p1  ORF type:complete len:424 (-),score=70.84 GGOE01063455.1:289-1560(-)